MNKMKKRIGRLLRPNMAVYLSLMLLFVIPTVLLRQYAVAGIELAVWILVLVVYLLHRANRKKKLKAYLEKSIDSQAGVRGQRPPFPMAVVRMEDNAVVYANDQFITLTAFSDIMVERDIVDILPGFNMDWLSAGKEEYPYDLRIQGRRFRVYGSLLQAGDVEETQLGVLYFADLTELYQVRDEYIRSRPVVSIILVDNYEELTKSLTEAAVSTLNAKINDAIMQWTEDYHGLLRRLERNRYLFVFEKRDLKRAVEDKFSLLEDVHAITSPSGIAASISFGIGAEGETFEEGYKFAA